MQDGIRLIRTDLGGLFFIYRSSGLVLLMIIIIAGVLVGHFNHLYHWAAEGLTECDQCGLRSNCCKPVNLLS